MSIDPEQIGKPQARPKPRHHKRTPTGELLAYWLELSNQTVACTATGYLPELTKDGKEVWPKGDESTWKQGLRGVSTGERKISIWFSYS